MTLSRRLLLLIGLALTPPLVIGILNDVQQRIERANAMTQQAKAESRSVQDSMALVTDGAHRLLIALAESPAIRSGDPAMCRSYLQAVSTNLKEYALLAVARADGQVVCTNNGPSDVSITGRSYYQRVMATGQFSVGDLVMGASVQRPSIHFALPFHALNGTVAGMVIASVDQTWLGKQLATEAVPPGAQVLLLDGEGVVIAAAEDGRVVSAPWLGSKAPAGLLNALGGSMPHVVDTPGPDGKSRLFGVLPPSPALLSNTVVVGLDRERAFQDLRSTSLRNLLGLGIGGLVALVAGFISARRFVLQPLARISAAVDRAGAGDLEARTDLGRESGEIREVGAGIDRMIALMGARERERDRAEAALRREEARLQLALAAGGLGTFEWNLRTNAVVRSDRVGTMFGFGPTEGLVSTDYFARIVPEDLASTRAGVQTGMETGRAVLSYRIRRGDEQRYILAQSEFVTDPNGDPVMIGLVADETDRVGTMLALQRSEERFQAIADCIDQMVWSTRADGVHDYFNQRWYEFTGTEPDGTDAQTWAELFHPDDHDETLRTWSTSLASGTPFHCEFRLRHVSGRYRWVLGRAQAITDELGRIIRWYGTCTDIDEIVQAREVLARSREVLSQEVANRTSELMAAEEQLRQSQKMEAVGQLTGGIAHDFNNMLQAIGGALELLMRRVEQDKMEEAKRFAGIARTTVDRAASLTHRLLAFARRQTLSPEPVDPVELVESMSELVARTVGPAIKLLTVHDGTAWPVLCDRNQLENVIFNLCINARDAMPDGGTLSITARNVVLEVTDVAGTEGAAPGDYIEIAVTDTGAGMDEETQSRAFEPFFTTKPLGQGTGLGLSQVYGFVRQSGGFVRLESQPERGTTVRLFLLRHVPAPVEPEPDSRRAETDGAAQPALTVSDG